MAGDGQPLKPRPAGSGLVSGPPRRARLAPGLFVLTACWLCQPAMGQIPFKGMSYTPWSEDVLLAPESDTSIANMKAVGVNTVALNVWWFQDDAGSTEIAPDFGLYSASTPSVIHAIQDIHGQGMAVMLKPMVDCRDGTWRGLIQPSEAWFAAYGSFIDGWAVIAETEGVEMLSIGCEFRATISWSSHWRDVISGVRAGYSGPILYSANHDSCQSVAWWDDLDYIGIDAYFALTDKDDPTPAELVQAWQDHSDAIEAWRTGQGYTQPVLFSEVGYRSADGANRRPWQWGQSEPVDLGEQADCYEALLSTMWHEEWFDGPFWWNWETDPNAGGATCDGYTAQNKPAEQILADYYIPHPGDANEDRVVNVGDLGILGTNYGQSGKTFSDGDFNDDGLVNVGDLGILGANYGWSGAGGALPEPASVSMIALAAIALSRRRRRPHDESQ